MLLIEQYKISQKLFLFAEIVVHNMEQLAISSLKEVRISDNKEFIWHSWLCSCLEELPYLHLCVPTQHVVLNWFFFPPLFSDGKLRLHWCDLLIQILQQCLVCCSASGTDQ